MKIPKDARSTGRKRGRKALFNVGREYSCECVEDHEWHDGRCGYSPKEQSRSDTLDVNHKNKNVLDNDPVNLEWLCRRCHKEIDSRTAKGVARKEESDLMYEGGFGFGELDSFQEDPNLKPDEMIVYSEEGNFGF